MNSLVNFLRDSIKTNEAKFIKEVASELSNKYKIDEREIIKLLEDKFNNFWGDSSSSKKNLNATSKDKKESAPPKDSKKEIDSKNKKESVPSKKEIPLKDKKEAPKKNKKEISLKDKKEVPKKVFNEDTINKKIKEAKEKGKYYNVNIKRLIGDGSEMKKKYEFFKDLGICGIKNSEELNSCLKYFKKDIEKDSDEELLSLDNEPIDDETNKYFKNNNGNWVDKDNYVYDITDKTIIAKEEDGEVVALNNNDIKNLKNLNKKYKIKTQEEIDDISIELSNIE